MNIREWFVTDEPKILYGRYDLSSKAGMVNRSLNMKLEYEYESAWSGTSAVSASATT